MKTVLSLLISLAFCQLLPAQSFFETSRASDGSKVLNGLISRSDIEDDSSFSWFQQNYKLGRADQSAVDAFKKHRNNFQMVIFVGSWCEDTHNLLPGFYRLTDLSDFPDSSISLIGVKEDKTTAHGLTEAFAIEEVPTFIVMYKGKEVGRVVEYGKYGKIDKELGEIVDGLPSN